MYCNRSKAIEIDYHLQYLASCNNYVRYTDIQFRLVKSPYSMGKAQTIRALAFEVPGGHLDVLSAAFWRFCG
jgi:hypothetical protein